MKSRIVDRLYAAGLTPEQIDLVATILFEERVQVAAPQGLTPLARAMPPQSITANEGVYFIEADLTHPLGAQFFKIGHSKNIAARVQQVRRGSALAPAVVDLSSARLVRVEPGGQAREQELHHAFARYRKGNTEWFSMGKDLLKYLGRAPAV